MNQQEMYDLVDCVNREDNMNENLDIEALRDVGIVIKNFWCSVAIKNLMIEIERRDRSMYYSAVSQGLVIH